MAKDKLTDYDPVASNNQDLGGISVAEGMLPSGVNNAIREQMSHLADFAAGNSGVDVLKLQDNTDTNSIKLQAPASVTADTTFTLPDGDGSADQVLKTDGSGQLGFADRHANPSLIINGAMQVAQRGTSFTGITDQYTLDRWTSSSAGGVSLNVSQQTATSSDNAYFASKYFARYQRNAVLSGFIHKVENLQQFNNKTFTLSFWAKSSDAGTNVTITPYTVNDGSTLNSYVTRTYVTNPTLSSTWQKYEMRLTFQDMYTYGYSGSHHLRLQFFDGSNAATFDVAEVKLEVGSTATDFVHRSFGEELALCQRYFCKSYNYDIAPGASGSINNLKGAAAVSGGTSTANRPFWSAGQYPVIMRSEPTIVLYHYDGTSGKITGSSFATYDGSAVNIGERGFNLHPTGNVSNSDDEDHYAIFTASAEL